MTTFNSSDQLTGAIRYMIDTEFNTRFVKEKCPEFIVRFVSADENVPAGYLVQFCWIEEINGNEHSFKEDGFSFTENETSYDLRMHMDSIHKAFHADDIVIHGKVLTEEI